MSEPDGLNRRGGPGTVGHALDGRRSRHRRILAVLIPAQRKLKFVMVKTIRGGCSAVTEGRESSQDSQLSHSCFAIGSNSLSLARSTFIFSAETGHFNFAVLVPD